MGKIITIHDLVDQIYDSALDAQEWRELLATLARYFNTEYSDFHLLKDGQFVQLNLTNSALECWQEYFDNHHDSNPRIAELIPAMREGSVFTDRPFFSRDTMKQSCFYDFLHKNDIASGLMAKIIDRDRLLGCIGFHRSSSNEGVDSSMKRN